MVTKEVVREAQSLLLRWRRALKITTEPTGWTERDVDGIPGPRTRAAVARFQRTWNLYGRNALPTDGTIDDETLEMLRRDVEQVTANEPDPFGWKPDDYRALADAAAKLGARPADLQLVLFSESWLKPSAAFRDPKTGFPVAVGLNQITPTNARAMGLSEAQRVALLKMTPAEQLPFVVRSIRAAGGDRQYTDAGMLYQVNFAPATLRVGSGDDVVMYRREQGAVYTLNAGLDVDKSGTLTVGDLRAVLRRTSSRKEYRDALTRLRGVVGGHVTDPVVHA